jgi:hypothetical protein
VAPGGGLNGERRERPQIGRSGTAEDRGIDGFSNFRGAEFSTLRRAAAKVDRASVAHSLLAAAISQCEGDVGAAIRILERALARSREGDRDYVVEVLGPL